MSKSRPYLVIPRRFRPQTFASMVGQEAIVTTLKNALRFERLAHAYLFCGCRGTGKTTLARLFAKALNCQNLTPEQEPCNSCTSCLEISSGRSLDVLEIDGASNRGIDDIREINETVGYSPASGKYKIYIIDEVHMLTKEAFNALLKTLEEPPAQIKFFFATTEPHKVPPTITSRCQRFDLCRISEEACVKKLSSIAAELKIEVEPEALLRIAQRSEGSLRDAESLLDQLSCYSDGVITEEKVVAHLGLTPQSSYFELDLAISKGDLSFAFTLSEEIFNAGRDLGCFLEGLMDHFRLLLLIKLRQPLPLLTEREKASYLASAQKYTDEQCLYILDFLKKEWQNFSKTLLKRVTLEMILLHLLRTGSRVSLDSLVRRLSELEGTFSTDNVAASQKPTFHADDGIKEAPVKIRTIEEALKEKIEITRLPEVKEEQAAPPPKPVSKVAEVPVEVAPPLALPPAAKQEVKELLPEERRSSSAKDEREYESRLDPALKEPELRREAVQFEPPSPPTPLSWKEVTPVENKRTVKHETLLRFTAVELEGTIER
ncbi:MAG: DNA polymerase III subunit gamma/tau [Chlamydiales bacterium]|nr:DNA polymerase III subunit gamma/tau [Chlamydiales bacterium]